MRCVCGHIRTSFFSTTTSSLGEPSTDARCIGQALTFPASRLLKRVIDAAFFHRLPVPAFDVAGG
jgi:hypothetical protein